MHEIGIANSILEAVRTEMLRYPATRPMRVAVRVGELAAIDPDALQFCFHALTQDTNLAGLQLEIEFCPRTHRCPQCSNTFAVAGFDFRCPQCGREQTKFLSGDQLELASLEVEEYESNSA
jgi:hydrogenase nickel incorporation protein HypA/HybF